MRRCSRGAAALVLALAACGAPRAPDDFLVQEPVALESAPLGGEALGVRRLELRRAQGDLVHFLATLETLQQRGDRSGQVLFTGFLEGYLGRHLAPRMQSQWQSQHAELAALDAGIRLLEVELLVRMREPGRAAAALDEIRRRYRGRESMLVDHPVGQQSPLGEAVERLAERKWRG